MDIKKISSYLIWGISIILFAAPIIERTNYKSANELIEVCDNGIVYVPQGTAFVKCHGVIKKAIKIESVNSEKIDCNCPTCCNGQCYIWISCAPISNNRNETDHIDSEKKDNRAKTDYCRLWMPC